MSAADLICICGIALVAAWRIAGIESTGEPRLHGRAENFDLASGDYMRYRGRP